MAIGVVDFDAPSSSLCFYVLDLVTGGSSVTLVVHGRGSDPAHSGWVERFSNIPGSEASSAGAYLTAEVYDGKHARARRLKGSMAITAMSRRGASSSMLPPMSMQASRRQAARSAAAKAALPSLRPTLTMSWIGSGPDRLIYVDKISAAA